MNTIRVSGIKDSFGLVCIRDGWYLIGRPFFSWLFELSCKGIRKLRFKNEDLRFMARLSFLRVLRGLCGEYKWKEAKSVK